MHLGRSLVGKDTVAAAAELAHRGARLVCLENPVDMTGPPPAVISALTFVRELTSHGIVVDWQLHATDCKWQRWSHLYPPATIVGGSNEDLQSWTSFHRLYRLIYRLGPDFMQIRDQRAGGLLRYTISGSQHSTVVEKLLHGTHVSEVPAKLTKSLSDIGVVDRVGEFLWWLPNRPRRWPVPAYAA
ncbi:DUF5825 family protein [Streptomyces collinus]|uniref:DUF5825 family protein n=1 Tax=Streptomyces collinus TaxID=42684 RepID=UPI003676D99A